MNIVVSYYIINQNMLFIIFIAFTCFALTRGSNNFDGPFVYQLTSPIGHAECPTWDSRTNLLYYVDIHVGKIYSYNYFTKEIRSITLDGQVAPVIPAKIGLIVGINRSVQAVNWDGIGDLNGVKLITNLAIDKPTSRLNDGKADSEGRLWLGTMGYETKEGQLTPNDGTLYKITSETEIISMISPVNISNGLAWNRNNNKFFYIDSPTRKIVQYDYEVENGDISNKKIVFDLELNHIDSGVPDGMTIDEDDNLWIALYGGGSIIKINPKTGKLLQRIAIPAECVTSVMWGGPDLDILFVTTSQYSLTREQKAKQPGAGAIYAIINTGTKGLPMHETNLIY